MTETWKIGYRFNPRTGTVKPWEVVNTVFSNGRVVAKKQWGSFKTEASAAKSVPKAIASMRVNPIWVGVDFENVGRMA